MKKQLVLTLLLLKTLFALGQSDVTILNGYKYVYLAPSTYGNGTIDNLGIQNQVKSKLIASGLQVIETATMPSDIDVCHYA